MYMYNTVIFCRGINFVLSALVFNVFPTIFEVTLVSSILVCNTHTHNQLAVLCIRRLCMCLLVKRFVFCRHIHLDSLML